MSDWPLTIDTAIMTVGQNYASSRGITVTAPVSANAKGAWTQIVASTPMAAKAIMIDLRPVITGDGLVDIALGATSFETPIIENLIVAEFNSSASFIFPVSIPANSRISARLQATTGSNACYILIMLLSHGFPGISFSRITTYGAAIADSGGTQVDPGGTLNTKNSWSQITAATQNNIRMLNIGIGNVANSARAAATWLTDIAIGPAGQEHEILRDLMLSSDTAIDTMTPKAIGPFPVSIPPGSRIAARAQCSITDATDRLFDVAVYGVD